MNYPESPRGDLVETLHGVEVADPYRWLEDIDSPHVATWVGEQNQVTRQWLDAHAGTREQIRSQLSTLNDFTRWGPPLERGGRWFATRLDAGGDQPVIVVSDTPESDGRVLLDPAEFGVGDATATVSSWKPSPDGRLLVYARSDAGSDWMTWRIRDVESGRDLDDEVNWSKFCEASWLPDGSGFVYSAFDPPAPGEDAIATTVNHPRICLHRLGGVQSDDVVVHREDDPELMPESYHVSNDGSWLAFELARGTNSESMVRAVNLAEVGSGSTPPTVVDLVEKPLAAHVIVGIAGSVFYLLTDEDAPMRRLVAIDADDPDRARREVIAEGPDRILEAMMTATGFVLHLLHDASSRLEVYDRDGALRYAVELPAAVTVEQMAARDSTDMVGFSLHSFTDPRTAWILDTTNGDVRRVHDAGAAAEQLRKDIVVDRGLATSADGAQVPVFLVHRQDVTANGEVPTLLYGYGGFDIPITPQFRAYWRAWVDRGGLLAIPNLRGGGEFGRSWYEAGKRERKQNVFDDMCACAAWLGGESGWSRPSRIAVNGGSNGGLLVGACITQQPDLFGAAVPQVGVLDLYRFHKFTIGWAWTSDYGNPDVAEEWEWVRGYSPLHRIQPGRAYPPTLITTGDHDDRVLPAHSYKFAAALQAAQGGDAPILLRIDVSAGHGLGKPMTKLLDEYADILAFVEAALR